MGNRVPTINTGTNRFSGNLETNFGFFNTYDEREEFVDEDNSDDYREIRRNYPPPSHFRNRQHQRRPSDSCKSMIKKAVCKVRQ